MRTYQYIQIRPDRNKFPRIHNKFFAKSWFYINHEHYTDFFIKKKKKEPTTSFLGKLFNRINGDDNEFDYEKIFTLYFNIENPRYLAEDVLNRIEDSLKELERQEEIDNGDLLPKDKF